MADSPLVALIKSDVEDLKARYKAAFDDGHFEVSELFALGVVATLDVVKAVEGVPGATDTDKKTAALEALASIAGAVMDEYGFPHVPAVVTASVIKPALQEVVKYFAGALVDKLTAVLVKEGVLKAAQAA